LQILCPYCSQMVDAPQGWDGVSFPCNRCGESIGLTRPCPECGEEIKSWAPICPHCHVEFRGSRPGAPAADDSCADANRGSAQDTECDLQPTLVRIAHLAMTPARMILRPREYFRTFRPVGICLSFAYLIVCLAVGLAGGYLWRYALSILATGSSGQVTAGPDLARHAESASWFLACLLVQAIGAFLILQSTGEKNRSFRLTVSVVVRAGATGFLLYAIPILGSIAGPVCWLVWCTIGLSVTHRIGWLRAAVCSLLPIGVWFGAFFIWGLLGGLAMPPPSMDKP
jgi:hypothetical protein